MGRLRILIAEDEEHILREIHEILDQAGYEVLPYAYSADDAIRKAEKFNPDLVVMDINFSNDAKDGIYAADYIRRRLNRPVVYVTGAVDHETVERAKLTSPYSYVLKPIEKNKILVSIDLARHNWEVDQKLRQHERAVARAYVEGQDKQKIRLEDALHEGIGARLSAMNFYVSMLKETCDRLPPTIRSEYLGKSCQHLQELDALLSEATQAIRRISFELVPNTLLNNGLEAGIQALEKRLLETDPELDLNLEIEYDERVSTDLRLSQEIELGVYWLIFDLVDYYRYQAQLKEIVMRICLNWDDICIIILESWINNSWYSIDRSSVVVNQRNLEARLNLLEAVVDIPEEQPVNRPYRFIHIRIPLSLNHLQENGIDQATRC